MTYVDNPDTQRSNTDYIRASMRQPLLERDHELDLARRWRDQNDVAALHELVKSYMRLVVSTATRFKAYGLPVGDLIQEGNIGLMQAAARFEPERDVRFSTYAAWWIRSAMQDYILRNWSIVRIGSTASQKSLFFKMRHLAARLGRDGDPGPAEVRDRIAEALNVKVKDVEGMEGRLTQADQSLNLTIGEDGSDEFQSLLPDDGPTPDEIARNSIDGEARKRWLHEAMATLSPREQTIINQRRLTDEALTLEELGQQLGVSKERVRQLEQRAMNKLRAVLVDRVETAGDLL